MNENPNYPADDKDIPVDLPKDPEIPAEPLFEPMDQPPEFKVNIKEDAGDEMTDLFAVSYTHLDVYKRQPRAFATRPPISTRCLTI